MPGGALDVNLGLVTHIWKNSVSPNTWCSSMNAWRKWCVFCYEVDCDCFKCELGLVISFVCKLINDQLSASSINKILAGISF